MVLATAKSTAPLVFPRPTGLQAALVLVVEAAALLEEAAAMEGATTQLRVLVVALVRVRVWIAAQALVLPLVLVQAARYVLDPADELTRARRGQL
jgi:hypothetical protein